MNTKRFVFFAFLLIASVVICFVPAYPQDFGQNEGYDWNSVHKTGYATQQITGKIGIGTAPSYLFDILGTTNYPFRLTGASGSGLIFGSYNSTHAGIWPYGATLGPTTWSFLCHPTAGTSLNAPTGGLVEFYVNNAQRARINSTNFWTPRILIATTTDDGINGLQVGVSSKFMGPVLIGTGTNDPTNTETLRVCASDTSSVTALGIYGTIASYFQLNIKNRSNSGSASSDICVTADNGDETSNYIDMGINSSQYNLPDYNIGGPNGTYVLGNGREFTIGTLGDYPLIFHTGGATGNCLRVGIDDTDASFSVTIRAASESYFYDTAWFEDVGITGVLGLIGSMTITETLLVQGLSTLAGASLTADLYTNGYNIVTHGNSSLRNDSVDGADDGSYAVDGGGAATVDRGGAVIVYGNEAGSPGCVEISAGDIPGGEVRFYTDNRILRGIFDATGSLELYYPMLGTSVNLSDFASGNVASAAGIIAVESIKANRAGDTFTGNILVDKSASFNPGAYPIAMCIDGNATTYLESITNTSGQGAGITFRIVNPGPITYYNAWTIWTSYPDRSLLIQNGPYLKMEMTEAGIASFSDPPTIAGSMISSVTTALQWDGGATGLTAATGLTSLGVPNHNLFLMDSSGNASFPCIIYASMPYIIAYSGVDQNFPPGTSLCSFSTEISDSWSLFDGISFLAPATGQYDVYVSIYASGTVGTGYRQLRLYDDGVPCVPDTRVTRGVTYAAGETIELNTTITLAKGHLLQVTYFHNEAGDITGLATVCVLKIFMRNGPQ